MIGQSTRRRLNSRWIGVIRICEKEPANPMNFTQALLLYISSGIKWQNLPRRTAAIFLLLLMFVANYQRLFGLGTAPAALL